MAMSSKVLVNQRVRVKTMELMRVEKGEVNFLRE